MSVDILVVEDEPGIQQSLRFILERAGWSVEIVADGQSALATLAGRLPGMVLLDVMLPKLSGFDVLKRIRSTPALAHLPVLILTAKGQQQDKQTAQELGANAFVTKPYANADLVEAVGRVLSAGVVI